MTEPMTMRPLGLRERKKLKAMRHIQEVALDLFDRDGYAHVTIERIAAEAEVSPSSVYRYFGTKEMVILWDEWDPIALRAFDEGMAVQDPILALREVLSDVVTVALLQQDEHLIRRRMQYAMTEPDVWAGMHRQADEMAAELRKSMAKHTGRDPDGLEVRVVTAALVAAFMEAILYWHETGYRDSMREIVDGALDVIARGLRVE
ncbi:TetR/AcrR family transcriptional regulator [Jiangella alkaliphila]|uniref:DNA-binding transcriptional regulator, AcrR family n=1 Tax=Jiangella alkaliphila TaxID=419479 RepID=A0A1H2H7P0_9ACTN|nr:TetR/AcrR family transcriptional regulator [Jiangella alkaliphila]SDU27823.1 DNA-binding transcriptional regulator, AcrR family [Jiangella alkaliphila]